MRNAPRVLRRRRGARGARGPALRRLRRQRHCAADDAAGWRLEDAAGRLRAAVQVRLRQVRAVKGLHAGPGVEVVQTLAWGVGQ